MMQGINLLPQDIQQERKAGDRAVVINAASVAVLVTLGSVAMVLFSYRVYLSRQAQDLDNQLTTIERQIGEKRTLEGKLQSLHTKLDVLGRVFAERTSYPVLLNDLQDSFTDNGTILGITLGEEEENTAQVSAEVFSLPGLAEVLGDLEAKDYQNANITSVKFDEEEGVFRVEIEMLDVQN